jgi:hypothetical protein
VDADQMEVRLVGRELCERFFALARRAGRCRVQYVPWAANHASLAFHRGMGFQPCQEEEAGSGVPGQGNTNGPGEDWVVLVREL